MALFTHDQQNIHYLTRGRGEPLLLIHGLGSSGADWALQVQALEGRFRLVVPDLPGCGHSGPLGKNCSIGQFAASLWALLDHLDAPQVNIAGFSLGGAVALEMALQRPGSVPRLALINSLATYRVDHWRKWLEARLPGLLISLLGMRRMGGLCAARMFPHPWQLAMRERARDVIGAVPAASYLGIIDALERWTAVERIGSLRSRILVIAAEHDYVPLQDKRVLAALLNADLLVVAGSRHGTPFDAVAATNAGLLALMADQMMPSRDSCACDAQQAQPLLDFAGSLSAQHALGPVV